MCLHSTIQLALDGVDSLRVASHPCSLLPLAHLLGLHMHTCTHARTHARTHACTHPRTHHACTHPRTHTPTHTPTHARTHPRMHAHTHARTCVTNTSPTQVSLDQSSNLLWRAAKISRLKRRILKGGAEGTTIANGQHINLDCYSTSVPR